MVKLTQYKNTDLGLFLVRLGIGLVFIIHGWMKLSDMTGTLSFFVDMLHVGAFWAYLVAWVEFLGGLSMLLGVWTYWTGVILAINMVFAIVLVKVGKGFAGGYEFDLLLLLASLAIATVGPGKYTAESVLPKKG
ncbi:MAG: DoxX family protein [Patescibacteria group bacterium]|mgnify:FL=1